MDPRDFFRGFFGFPGGPSHREKFGDEEVDPRDGGQRREGMNFHVDVFTNPLEMHKFFDQQMDQVLKSFGFGQGFGGFPFAQRPRGGEGGLVYDGGDDHDPSEESSAGSREFMLKDGFGFSPATSAGENKEDRDLDDSVNLDRLFKKDPSSSVVPIQPPSSSWMAPFFEMPRDPQSRSFFYSSSTRQETVRLSDGTIECRTTQRSNDGCETTTVTRTGVDGKMSRTVTSVTSPEAAEEDTRAGSWVDGRALGSKEDETVKYLFDKFFGSSR